MTTTGTFDLYPGKAGRILRIKAIRLAQLFYGPPQPECGCGRCTLPPPPTTECRICETPCDSSYSMYVDTVRLPLCYNCFQRIHNPD